MKPMPEHIQLGSFTLRSLVRLGFELGAKSRIIQTKQPKLGLLKLQLHFRASISDRLELLL